MGRGEFIPSVVDDGGEKVPLFLVGQAQAQRVYVMRNGHVSFTGMADELKDDAKLKVVYL